MIPHVAHFFWANDTLSWLRYMTLVSFRHFNPDWEMQIHRYVIPHARQTWATMERQDFGSGNLGWCKRFDYWPRVADLPGVEVVDWQPPCDVISPVHASDIFQWQMLSTAGGLYCDMDILFVAPVATAIRDLVDTYVCLYLDVFPIGFLAACPHNQFYADVLRTATASQNENYQSAGCEAAVATIQSYDTFIPKSPREMTTAAYEKCRLHAVKMRHRNLSFVNLRRETVYPFWWDRVAEIFTARHTTLPDGCVGIHWYAGAPLSQQFNREMHHANFGSYKSTISYFAARVLNDADYR